jgi:hypothetical protein
MSLSDCSGKVDAELSEKEMDGEDWSVAYRDCDLIRAGDE